MIKKKSFKPGGGERLKILVQSENVTLMQTFRWLAREKKRKGGKSSGETCSRHPHRRLFFFFPGQEGEGREKRGGRTK